MTAGCMLLWFPWDEEEEEFSKTPRKEMRRKEETEYKPEGFFKSQLKKGHIEKPKLTFVQAIFQEEAILDKATEILACLSTEQLSNSESSSSPTVLRHKESVDLLSGSGADH